MNSELISVIGGLGLSLVLYAIGRILLNLSLFMEDSGRDDFLNKLLTYTSFAFFFLGFPATAIIGLVQSYPQKRMCEAARKEERESMKKICRADIKAAVEEEHDRLVAFYKDLMCAEKEKVRAEESERWRNRLHEMLDKRNDTE